METINTILNLSKYTTTQILSICIQAFLFTSSLTHLLISLMSLVRFSYAKPLANSRIILITNIFLFIYFRAWGAWHRIFIIWGYFCATIVSLYACDCSCSIATTYRNNIRGYYYGQVVFYIIVTMFLPLWFLFSKQNQIILYTLLVEIAFIALINAFRNRHIVNAAVVSFSTFLVPIGRVLVPSLIENQYLNRLPLQLIPILMMALDAEYRERGQEHKGQGAIRVQGQLLKSCCFFLGYAAVNGHIVHIELMIPFWFLILILSGRDIS